MRRKLKKILAAGCIVSMLMTMPGVTVLADELQEEEFIVTEVEDPEETIDSVGVPDGDAADDAHLPIEVIPDENEAEEVIAAGAIQVGDGVTATFNANTGAVEFTSRGGELWIDWVEKMDLERNEIKSIKVASGTVFLPANSSGLRHLKYYMFGGLCEMTTLDLRNFDTSKVIDMSHMFEYCIKLTSLDLSRFNTSKVTNMDSMFAGCASLTDLDLSRFDTSNVTSMEWMFSSCDGLTNLDLSNFDTSKVTSMMQMFDSSDNLKELNLSSFDTSKVTDMTGMFRECNSLTNLDLSSFITPNLVFMTEMFWRCNSLKRLDLSNFDTSMVDYMGRLFYECSSLVELDLSSFDTSKVTDMHNMFDSCTSLRKLNLSSFNTSNVTSMDGMFRNCSNLIELDLRNFNTANVSTMCSYLNGMFCGCRSLTNLDLSSFDTSKAKSMERMFYNCESLIDLDLSSFNTVNVTDMTGMFQYCTSLRNVDLSSFNTSHLERMGEMFSDCTSLTSLSLRSFNTSNVTDMGGAFYCCGNLISLDLSSFDTSNVTNMGGMFNCCSSLTTLDLKGFNTSNVSYMSGMFGYCKCLTGLDLSGFDMSSVRYAYQMTDMFKYCSALEILKTPKNIRNVISLPVTMYDGLGNMYTEIPIQDESITLVSNLENLYTISLDKTHSIDVLFDDKMFSESSYEYNHSLARFSSAMSLFSYKSKALIKDGYKTLGFTISDDSIEKINQEDATGDKANYAIGKKEITTDDGQYTLVALSIVGSNGREWITNFQPGTGDTHQYFLEGKKHVRSALDEYMEKNGLTDTSKVKILITGHSRGAAVANLLAAEIDNGFYKVEPENIYTYTFATPKNTRLPDTSDSLYDNIFNFVNPEDFVTWCMPAAWRFSRYGHTLTLPSKSNTNNKLYKNYLSRMQSEFSHYRDGSYDPYKDGQLPVYLVYKHVVLHAWNQKAYEQIRYPILLGYGPSVKQRSFRDFFSGGLAPIIISDALKKADKEYEVAAAALIIADSFFTSAYGPVIQFFLLEEALGKIPGTGGWSQNQANQSLVLKLKQLPTAINENFTDAHLMETYAAYMMTLEEEVINKTKMPYVSVLNWPGNIEIFNADGELVGSVIDNVVDETIEKRVAIEVDGDSKSFMIPEGEAYTVNLSGNDAGVMDYSVIQLDGEGNELERHNYLNVDVPASQEWEIEYPEDRESVDDIIVKDNTNDTVIPVTESIDEDGQGTLSVDVSVEGIGAAEGITNLTSGDCVTLTAYTDDNNYFEGWYEAGDLVSEDSEYSFIVTEDRELIARFSSVIVPATGIKLQESEKQLTVDEDYLLLPELIPENATRQEIMFSSSDESVATVSEYGLVIAVGTGSAVITASSNDGEYTDTCAITVNEITKKDPTLRFRDVQVTKTTLDTAFTNTLTKETDGTVTFKSSDTKVATVDSTTGLVTIKGIGTATITATASEGKNYKAGSIEYSLIVKAPPTPTPTPKPTVSGFSDVQDPNHAYYKAIYWAADAGITKGYSDGTFGINKSCSRGEMMMFLWRYAGKPSPKAVSKSPFKDVPKTHTFYKAILWGSQKGITKGYPDGSFGINKNVSRGECMMFLWRLKGKPAPKAVTKSPFKDVPKTHAFYKAILWGSQKKVTTGYTSGTKKGTFGINENCTRGQIVTFLYRAK